MTRKAKRGSRERIAVAVATAGLDTRYQLEAQRLGDIDAIDDAAKALVREQKRDPFLDTVQRLFSTDDGREFLEWLVQHTLAQRVRIITTKTMPREAAQDFALFREGQNSVAEAVLSLINRANNETPVSRTDRMTVIS